MMAHDEMTRLAQAYREGRIDRRRLMQRAGALGAAAGMAGGFAMVGPGSRIRLTRGQEAETAGGLVTVSTEQNATWTPNFNPFGSSDGTTRWPTHAGIYEPLIVFNTIKGEIVPWLATGYEFSADNLQLTFTIREGVMWSDGQPFSGADVLYTFRTLKETAALTGFGAVRGVLDDYITDIQGDETSVTFTFSKAYTPGLYDIGEQSIAPEHIFKDVADLVTFTNDKPVGTGPFTEIPVFRDNIYEVHRNPTYWQEGKPYVQGFRLPAYPTNDAANLATTNGENDWAGNFIPDIEATYVAKDPEHYGYWFPAVGATVHLFANTTRPPFDDPNVRKAISMAINRDQIVEIAMYDYTHPADSTGLSDAYTAWKTEEASSAEWVTMNVDKANELLDAAGLARDGDVRKTADGTEMSYDINVVTGWSDWVQSCDIMAQNLADIGIQAKVQPYDFGAWYDRVSQGDFDLSIGWTPPGATPFNFYRGMMASSTKQEVGTAANENWHRYASTDADALLEQFAATSDQAEQQRIAGELQALYAESAPAIPLFPGPQWGEYNTTRFTDFPSKENPYAILSTYEITDRLLVLTTIKPVEGAS